MELLPTSSTSTADPRLFLTTAQSPPARQRLQRTRTYAGPPCIRKVQRESQSFAQVYHGSILWDSSASDVAYAADGTLETILCAAAMLHFLL